MSDSRFDRADRPPAGAPLRCLVSGRVQGVWFRARTVDEAGRRGLSGFVRNLSDGRVEVVVGGEPEAVAEFVGWLWRGPELARVDSVVIEAFAGTLPAGFDVEATL